jgi:monoterpene epsilon-lactone hydrolase
MRISMRAAVCAALAAAVFTGGAKAQPGPPAAPQTLSAAGQAAMLAQARGAQPPEDLAGRRAFLDRTQAEAGARQQQTYAVDIKAATLGGVPVRIISPKGGAAGSHAILLDLHGGGFNSDSGSLTENIPIAALTGVPVVAVLYRLAPEHLAPAAVDDALAVYRELLKTHKASEIGVYGTSAGAILGPQLMMRLKAEKLPLPAVLGVFAGDADLSRDGASALAQHFDAVGQTRPYLGKMAATDPRVSPLLGDLKGFPPTLCMTSTGDVFLSGTVNFCRGLEAAGVENKLVVFDALPHAFWAYIDAPESDEAFQIMAKFLAARLPRGGR